MTPNQIVRKCLTCQYHRSLPGSEHSTCNHPWLAGENKVVAQHMAMKYGVCKMTNGEQELFVKLGEHDIMHGWANWPIEYDAIWVKECSGYLST